MAANVLTAILYAQHPAGWNSLSLHQYPTAHDFGQCESDKPQRMLGKYKTQEIFNCPAQKYARKLPGLPKLLYSAEYHYDTGRYY